MLLRLKCGQIPALIAISPIAQVALLQTEMNSGFKLTARTCMNSPTNTFKFHRHDSSQHHGWTTSWNNTIHTLYLDRTLRHWQNTAAINLCFSQTVKCLNVQINVSHIYAESPNIFSSYLKCQFTCIHAAKAPQESILDNFLVLECLFFLKNSMMYLSFSPKAIQVVNIRTS